MIYQYVRDQHANLEFTYHCDIVGDLGLISTHYTQTAQSPAISQWYSMHFQIRMLTQHTWRNQSLPSRRTVRTVQRDPHINVRLWRTLKSFAFF